MRESDIQQSCIQALSALSVANNFIFFAPTNEGLMTCFKAFKVPDKISRPMYQWFRKMGFLPGVSDIVIIHRGQAYFIELKTATGEVSDNQVRFMDNATKAGAQCVVVRSLGGMMGMMGIMKEWGIV